MLDIPRPARTLQPPPVRRPGVFHFSVVAYLLFFATFLYAIGFLGGFGVPKAIDDGPAAPTGAALATDLALLLVFGLQHSVMAREGFKRVLTRAVPAAAERSVYVVASCAALAALFALWKPLPHVVWSVDSPALRGCVLALFAGGWLLVLVATLLIDHLDLFGLRQGWLALTGAPYREHPFKTPFLYRYVRHPLYVGWITVFFAAPTMTVGRLLFAVVATAYILVALVFEERDLVRRFGAAYEAYRATTPQLLPRFPRGVRRTETASAPATARR
jgi:protein-S-isoprenylcysteine O-methyltransferase Ste14